MISLKTSKAFVRRECPAFTSSGSIITADDAYEWLLDQRKEISGWTYTCSTDVFYAIYPCRIIAQLADFKNENLRLADRIHAKCFIGDNSILIGSYNLVKPTNHELVFVTHAKDHRKLLVRTFEQHWKALS